MVKRTPHQADPETIRRWAEQAIQRQQPIFTAPAEGARAGQPARLFYNRASGPLPQVPSLLGADSASSHEPPSFFKLCGLDSSQFQQYILPKCVDWKCMSYPV